MSTSTNGAPDDDVDGEALDWALRMAEPDADWDAFTAWLEADPARAARYDAAAIALDRVTRLVADQTRPARVVANDVDPLIVEPVYRGHRRRVWLGGAVAATVAVALGLSTWYQPDDSYIVETRSGEQRTLALADGSSIVLSGGSRVKLDPSSPRSVSVEAGEMLFVVRHDENAQFRVRAGELQLVDLGTVFNVRMLGTETRVAVAEGAVRVDLGGTKVRLDPGQVAVLTGGTLRGERRDVAEIGAWQRGQLIFSNATLAQVAEELSRNLGQRITVASALRERTFNGTLEVNALRQQPALLGELLGVQVRRDGDLWTLDDRR
jgi:transmembrane sensor